MNDPDKILQDRLTTLCNEYICWLDDGIKEINDIWKVAQFDYCSSKRISQIKDIAGDLASSGAPFGLGPICDAANKLAQFLSYLHKTNQKLSEIHRKQTELLIRDLESASLNKNNPPHVLRNRRWDPSLLIPHLHGQAAKVYIVGGNHVNLKDISTELQRRGYQIRFFENFDSLKQFSSKYIPRVIITDQLTCDSSQTNLKRYPNVILDMEIPLICVGDRNDMDTHLKATGLGACCYLTLPSDQNKLITKVEELTSSAPKDPYRVMIIDDDRPMAEFFAFILKQEGMNITLVDNPLKSLEIMERTRPELVILNASMRNCSGLELTSIIRQQDKYAGISIVFLLNDLDIDGHIETTKAGGDDFISLPVAPDYLVTTINSRLRRARTLNTMNRDLYKALTDLENQNFAINQHAIVSITNINGNIIYVNDKFCEISGYSKSELIGHDHNILKSDFHDEQFFREIWHTIKNGNVWQGEICNKKKNGETYWLNMTIVPFMDEQSRPYQFVAIHNDITARILAEQNLLKARDVAIEANQAKSDFLSKMSHELRTPLNAVLGFSQLLESAQENSLTESQLQYTKEIKNAGEHLLNLINEILDLSRIEANQLLVENINIPLSTFLDECSALIKPMAMAKEITLQTNHKNTGDIYIYADPVRLKQIMINLLSNAIKYNKYSGEIRIDVKEGQEEEIIIEVSDTGVGIYPEQINELFQPFHRLPQHKTIEGAGIGLALSKRLIELMGGTIGVNSITGKGSTFWIKIQQAGSNLSHNERTQSKDYLKAESITTNDPYDLLYIEDNETNFKLVKEILANRPNIKLIRAISAEEGIEKLDLYKPDMILMDLQLPGMSGLEAIKFFRQNTSGSKIPIIAISALIDNKTIKIAHKKGFNDYITKPIEISNFLSTIDNCLEQYIQNKKYV